MRRFSLYRRNGKVFYCQFWNEKTHRYASGISTGQTSYNEAVATVVQWERTGIPERDRERTVSHFLTIDTVLSAIRSGNLTTNDAERITDALKIAGLIASVTIREENTVPLVDFLISFWNYDESPYVREKLAHGHSLSKTHCYERLRNVKNYWKPHFGAKLLADVTRTDLREFTVTLSTKGLATQTRNHILNAGTVAIRWAFTNEMIPTNPAEYLSKYSIQRRERGVLSTDEACRLFELQWDDERRRVANLVAMTTGLRAGEVTALRLMDLGDEYLSVNHSWSEQDGLKSTKTGDTRKVPLLSPVRDSLLTIANQNPHAIHPTSFVFWSVRESDRPMAARGFSDALREMLIRLTLPADERTEPAKVKKAQLYWKERSVTFHSWRHFYATNLANRIDRRKAMTATGHRTGAVFDVYANHESAETFLEVSNAVRSAFEWIS